MTATPPTDDGSPSSRRRARFGAVAALVALAIAVVAVVVITSRGPDDPVAEAIDIAEQEDGYDSGLEAGRTLARVASALNRGIRDCDRATEADRCAALGSVSGYVQVAAATVVRCTAPGRVEARQSVLGLLEELRARRDGDAPPPTPPVPTCRR